MKLLIQLSLRNLFRQKRRNLLLGAAIAFGMMVLVLLTGFASGLTDILLNRIIVQLTGHIQIASTEHTTLKGPIIRDRDFVLQTISNHVQGIKEIRENITVFARVVGNGRGESLSLVGKEPSTFLNDRGVYEVIEGKLDDFTNEGSAVLYQDKAKSLQIKIGDRINSRFAKIGGSSQTATYKVVATLRGKSFFGNTAVFVHRDELKVALGYAPWETSGIQIILKNPTLSEINANQLHQALTASPAALWSSIASSPLFPILFLSPTEVLDLKAVKLLSQISFISNLEAQLFISEAFAKKNRLTLGNEISISYPTLYEGGKTKSLKIVGIYSSPNLPEVSAIAGEDFYLSEFLIHPQALSLSSSNTFSSNLTSSFLPKWNLLPRTHNQEALNSKLNHLAAEHWKGRVIDIRTMYETASDIVKFEAALKTIAVYAVLLMFLIILIGVVNTLRMTIRERTREIGTLRALGMQGSDIRSLFLLETVFLAFFSSLVGIIGAFIVIGLFQLKTIVTDNSMGVFLLNGHIHFLVTAPSLAVYTFLILLITLLTAYFPARGAAKLKPADALRHAET
jgi:ABC-type lipoprotein release transport system permease subunit